MTSSTTELPRPKALSEVKGWFRAVDQQLFDWFLSGQMDRAQRGDLLELGAYMGKSAIFMASYRRAEDAFTVCDLFDSVAPDSANLKEMNKSYSTLTRRAFEANFSAFHERLPEVVQAPTSVVADRVADDSCRFAHIDASHLYEHVYGDIEAVRDILLPDGVVVLDDYRAEHCPGVAAATWGAVAALDLHPICVTGTKFYGTWGDPEPLRDALLEWLAARDDMWHEVQQVAGHGMIRIDGRKATEPKHPVSRYSAEEEPAAADGTGAPDVPVQHAASSRPAPARPATTAPPRRPGRARALAKDLLPPIVTRALARRRRGR
ncbi:class I SAM-dependent methyltransferase [Streptomyces sp. NPDC057620]|uniref:Class I SAM-dependent methyltransferase n=1 Tax=Streptomyces liliiviolaceus TaxID=2823109 RepID=A0A941B2Y6_9ACTN|nr:class I SAM-dependent methyltransferase [Streptomyces liliiviolaceus]MBQ0848650.1 class I SAM-dependent methyltransferase [Streptomyces liliiviolaceus]